MAAILLPLLPLQRNKAVNRTPLHTGRIADLRPLGAKSDRTVDAAGINPLEHYIYFGAAEGRLAFADGVFS